MMRRLFFASLVLGLATFLVSGVPAHAEEEPCPHGHAADDDAGVDDAGVEQNARRYTRSVNTYHTPDITLLDQEGREVGLAPLLDGSSPVALNFIFTSCATVCPVMTATFSQMHRALGEDAGGLRTVSITIDPEHDTPRVLQSYAQRFNAKQGWQFLTGDADEILKVQRAFDAYTGNKTNHRPFTLLRNGDSASWVRIDGLASGTELATEYRQLRQDERPRAEGR